MHTFYRTPALSDTATAQFTDHAEAILEVLPNVMTEFCFCVEASGKLTREAYSILDWLLAETFQPNHYSHQSYLSGCATVLTIGPRLNFETAWSSSAVAICQACGLGQVTRLERFLRIGLSASVSNEDFIRALSEPFYDRMTETWYEETPLSLSSNLKPKAVRTFLVLEKGKEALQKASKELGLGWDEQDIDVVYRLFTKTLQRNPTDVELFQIGQANSEHCRHHYFRGHLAVNGQVMPMSLMDVIKAPWEHNPSNSLIAFCDDSSAIEGCDLSVLTAVKPGQCNAIATIMRRLHPTLTAETHNFPSGIAPYPGAATGTGGRIRDNQAVGQGGHVLAGGAAYCVGNLQLPGYTLPWEQDSWSQPSTMASPLQILIEASNGASDYGNCFGEPVIYGFTRTCDFGHADNRRSWHKPIMYTVGAGQIDDAHVIPAKPTKGLLVVQVGGPAYRIGMGGGAASSMLQGANTAELDFDAVQRGNPEMEQRMNRLIRVCIELGAANPIQSLCDFGAGGACNAITEVVHPAGAVIDVRLLPLGDKSLSVLQIWGNEAQERIALLIKIGSLDLLQAIATREGVPCVVVGEVTGDGNLVLQDGIDQSKPVELPLKEILGDLPQKTFESRQWNPKLIPLALPSDLTVYAALDRVLRLPSVASKRFLTTKVDRSVTGRIVQQQCVGPNHITLSDYALIASSYQNKQGIALSLGEQPIKGLISPQAMARMAVAETLLNIAGVCITKLSDIKASANWMLAAKLESEGAWLYEAACALRDICIHLGIAPDGGKDSLSMATKLEDPSGTSRVVKAPGQLVISAYAGVPDVERRVTCDLKSAGNNLLLINLGAQFRRLGGSALAQVYGQLGGTCPDIDDVNLLERVFVTVQQMVAEHLIDSVHDVSDGGLIVSLLEMAFAGNLGVNIKLSDEHDVFSSLFSEEAGLVIETNQVDNVISLCQNADIPFSLIGKVVSEDLVIVTHNKQPVLGEKMTDLRNVWESTSSALDKEQANPECVEQEKEVNRGLLTPPPYELSFTVEAPVIASPSVDKPKVAILRERGSNGDREMAAAFMAAGFEPWDVTMTDLLSGQATLDKFRGLAFVGGFSFADVLDAGKGWAGVIRFNENLRTQFSHFYERDNTFSLGVCNGCQLMSLLGWIPGLNSSDSEHPRFIRNRSERFESRFPAVRIMTSPAIMLRGMEGSVLGVWTAHGEGQLHVPSTDLLERIISENLAPLRYVDRDGQPTEVYPHNPNGSPNGITSLCSPNGRHLAMMPHPERTFQLRLWPWVPPQWRDLPASPWLKLFQNAYDWCME